MDERTTQLNEDPAFESFRLTEAHDAIAEKYEAALVNNENETLATFLKAIPAYGLTCLDVGMAYGAQYFALQANFPEVTWTGVERSSDYFIRFASRFTENLPACQLIEGYDVLPFADNAFEVVTARSVLRHYSPEDGAKILDEMLRVASKAVIILLQAVPWSEEDLSWEYFGPWAGKGTNHQWSKPKWENYLTGKKVSNFEANPLIVVIEK